MRLLRSPRALVVTAVCICLIIVGVGVYLVRRSNNAALIEASSRINGDITILSFSSPFPDIEATRNAAARTEHVEHACLFTIYPVQLHTRLSGSNALLKLLPMDPPVVRDFGLQHPPLPYSDSAGVVDVAIGLTLAQALSIRVGDAISIDVEPGAGSTGRASVQCRVAALADFGLEHFNRQLIVADITALGRFSLLLTGVEVRTSPDVDRRDVARLLERQFATNLVAMTAEELLASRPPSN